MQVVTTFGGDEIVIGSKAWATKLRKQVKELSGEIDTSYMRLAELLYYVYDTKAAEPPYEPLYRTWGYISFKDYAEEELGLKDRKAEYLRGIWYRLEIELSAMDPATKKRLVALGWSKLRLLVQPEVLTLDNAAQWADRGEKASFAVLNQLVKDYKQEKRAAQATLSDDNATGSTPEVEVPQVEPMTQRSVLLKLTEAEVYDAAMHRASVLTGKPFPRPGEAMGLIVTDFLANSGGGTGHDAQLKYLAKLEEAMGLKFVVVDPESKEVMYGLSTLEMLAQE